ncbi:hypothetical protein [Mesoterricola silvestris]|uniref:Uncharacterized protein n=1 Tax=Mesoterricola silvestris TaxID=2927979 RepID=A0AA48K8S8_9BACT|nr:hypothetical protein [Mesoterricola silvestris]BDU73249.1 hypothetical protein METEAL_24230 [Mesoterricola silvestris]
MSPAPSIPSTLWRVLAAVGLLALWGRGPLQAREPIQAVLAINVAEETYIGVQGERPPSRWYSGAKDPGEDDFLMINPCLHHPFEVRVSGYAVTDEDLGESLLMAFPAPVQWSIEYLDRGRVVHRRPVSFTRPAKAANLLRIMLRHQALKAQEASLGHSWIWRQFGRFKAHPEAALAAARDSCSAFNCYTFIHFVHFSEILWLRPQFDAPKWHELSGEDPLHFGDLVQLESDDPALGDHFAMSLGGGLFLSKLGNSLDFLITNLDEVRRLYETPLADPLGVRVYRAN